LNLGFTDVKLGLGRHQKVQMVTRTPATTKIKEEERKEKVS
jgi:hypothetical protein